VRFLQSRLRHDTPDCFVRQGGINRVEVLVGYDPIASDKMNNALDKIEKEINSYVDKMREYAQSPDAYKTQIQTIEKEMDKLIRTQKKFIFESKWRSLGVIKELLSAGGGLAFRVLPKNKIDSYDRGDDVLLLTPAEIEGFLAHLKDNGPIRREKFGWFKIKAHDKHILFGRDDLTIGQYNNESYVLASVEPNSSMEQETDKPGWNVINADMTLSKEGEFGLSFQLDSNGASRFGRLTQSNIGNSIAIVVGDVVYSAPTVREPIYSGQGQITGQFSLADVLTLQGILLSGPHRISLKFPPIEETNINHSLWIWRKFNPGLAVAGAVIFVLFGCFAWMPFKSKVAHKETNRQKKQNSNPNINSDFPTLTLMGNPINLQDIPETESVEFAHNEELRKANSERNVTMLRLIHERNLDSSDPACLLAQTLNMIGKTQDAENVLLAALEKVKLKSHVAAALGQLYLFHKDDIINSCVWFFRSIYAQREKPYLETPYVYLSAILEVLGRRWVSFDKEVRRFQNIANHLAGPGGISVNQDVLRDIDIKLSKLPAEVVQSMSHDIEKIFKTVKL
jgi:hypothetical protein